MVLIRFEFVCDSICRFTTTLYLYRLPNCRTFFPHNNNLMKREMTIISVIGTLSNHITLLQATDWMINEGIFMCAFRTAGICRCCELWVWESCLLFIRIQLNQWKCVQCVQLHEFRILYDSNIQFQSIHRGTGETYAK